MQPTNIHRGEKQHIEYINGIDRGQRSINKEVPIIASVPGHRTASTSNNNTLKKYVESNYQKNNMMIWWWSDIEVLVQTSWCQQCIYQNSSLLRSKGSISRSLRGNLIVSVLMYLRVDMLCWALVKWLITDSTPVFGDPGVVYFWSGDRSWADKSIKPWAFQTLLILSCLPDRLYRKHPE